MPRRLRPKVSDQQSKSARFGKCRRVGTIGTSPRYKGKPAKGIKRYKIPESVMVFDLVLGLVEHKVVAVAGRKKLGDEVLIKGRDHRGSIILFRESNGWVFRERPEGKYFDHRSFVSLKKGDHVVLEHWKGYTTCRFGKFEGSMFERQAAS